jgi:hypothetical protein
MDERTLYFVLGGLGAAMLWAAILMANRRKYRRHHCPKCGLHFSDWFTWGDGGPRFCWPCWNASDYTLVIHER